MSTKIKTGKYKIPFKLPKQKLYRHKENEAGELELIDDEITCTYNLNNEQIKDNIDFINNNYEQLKTIYDADPNINQNKEIQDEVSGLLINIFKQKDNIADPIRVGDNPKQLDLSELIASGFDNDKFTKNKGSWNKLNINDFKQLFD